MKTTFKTILLSFMTAVFCVGSSINSSAQSAPDEGAVQVTAGKKPLDHSVYDKWYGMGGYLLTKDGKYSVIYQNRAENDGHIEIINLTDNYRSITINRSYRYSNRYVVHIQRPGSK